MSDAGHTGWDIDTKVAMPVFTTKSDRRKIITPAFVTLDGVMPGAGPTGRGRVGRVHIRQMAGSCHWTTRWASSSNELMKPPFAMLLGRTTYTIFAGFWPKQDPNKPRVVTPESWAAPTPRRARIVHDSGRAHAPRASRTDPSTTCVNTFNVALA
jgi:hypothetical protein